MDWFRRQKVRNAVVRNFSDFEGAAGDDGDFDILETLESLGSSLEHESAADSVSRAQILQLDRGRGRSPAGTSTRGFSAALLGGIRCRRDSRLHGLFGGQRQDALLAGSARLGQGPQGEGNRNMNTSARIYGPAAREAIESRFARNIAARLSERAENVAPEIGERLRFAREKALEVGRAGAHRRRGAKRPASGTRASSASAARPGGSGSPRCCPWRRWSAACC